MALSDADVVKMNGPQPIAAIKQQLKKELGPDNFNVYLSLLREWFAERLTKHMFDYKVSKVFQRKVLDLHNLLLWSILLECTGVNRRDLQLSVPSSEPSEPDQSSKSEKTSKENGILQPTATESHQAKQKSEIYMRTPIPGEELFIYPTNAKEYPVQVIEVIRAGDLMEQEPPSSSHVDSLHSGNLRFPADEGSTQPQLTNRFPPWLAHDYQRVNTTSYTHSVNIVPNVTHLSSMKDLIERKPKKLKPHFVVPRDKQMPFLTSGCSLYGKFVVKAWDHGIQNVNQKIVKFAVDAVRDHIKTIIVALMQQRRPFRMRDKRIPHSIGVPYPNPYLRQGIHLYDECYSLDTSKKADVELQVPAPCPTLDEKERLAALRVAASYSGKNSRFTSAKGTVMDLLCAVENNPSLIPHTRLRIKLLDAISSKNKGFAGSQNTQDCYFDEDDDSMQSSPLLPPASY